MKQCYYVAKFYSELMPTIVEEFPFTPEGYEDAKAYAEIMSRTKDSTYLVLIVDNA
jgi:hypothetical protein